MSTISIAEVLAAVSLYPALSTIAFDQIELFISLAQQLKPTINHSSPSTLDSPPLHLPLNVHNFILASTGIFHEEAKEVWDYFKEVIWSGKPSNNRSLMPQFL